MIFFRKFRGDMISSATKEIRSYLVKVIWDAFNNLDARRVNSSISGRFFMRKPFSKPSLIWFEAPWYAPIFTIIYDREPRFMLLVVIFLLSIIIYPDEQGALQAICLSIIAACIFYSIFELVPRQHKKMLVARRAYPYLRRVRERARNTLILLGQDQTHALTHDNVKETIENFEPNTLNENISTRISVKIDEENLDIDNKALSKREFLLFSAKKNIEDVRDLLNISDIDLFPGTFQALVELEGVFNWHNNITDNTCYCFGESRDRKNQAMSLLSYHSLYFQRLEFWSLKEMAIFNPNIYGMRLIFCKNSVNLAKQWGQILVGYRWVDGSTVKSDDEGFPDSNAA